MAPYVFRDYRQRLRTRRDTLVNDIYPDKVVDHLFQENVIDQDEMELILSHSTRRGQAVELLNRLQKTTAEGFGHFVQSLEETFPHLFALMKQPAMPKAGPEREAFVGKFVCGVRASLCIERKQLVVRVSPSFISTCYRKLSHLLT